MEMNQMQRMESENLNELYAALAKAQMEMEIARPEKSNPFFKSSYADLASIVKSSRPYLNKNGLCIIQRIVTNEIGTMYLTTRMGHSSGQWIESKAIISPTKPDIQAIGSYISYLKRYSYAAMAGVTVSDEDDDGEAAMQRNDSKRVSVNASVLMTHVHTSDILAGLQLCDPDYDKNILNHYRVSAFTEIKDVEYEKIMNAINSRKQKLVNQHFEKSTPKEVAYA